MILVDGNNIGFAASAARASSKGETSNTQGVSSFIHSIAKIRPN